MSIQNPLVVDFNVQTADAGQPTLVNFEVSDNTQDYCFSLTGEYKPVIQAKTYIYNQSPASNRWVINHTLKKYPSVTIVDTAGTVLVGGVQYIDENCVVCTFSAPFSGTAYLN